MKRRDLFKGLLGLFALGAPALAQGKERSAAEKFLAAKTTYYEIECTIIEWISVEDELPKASPDYEPNYLVKTEAGHIHSVAFGTGWKTEAWRTRWYFVNYNFNLGFVTDHTHPFYLEQKPEEKITHWAHLPKV